MYIPSVLQIVDFSFKRKVRIVCVFQNTLLFLIAFTVWVIGSLIVVQIDSDKKFEMFHEIALEEGLSSQLQLIDAECQRLVRKEVYQLENLKVEASEGPYDIMLRAKKEKIVRDNIIFIPELNQMWCLVPKAASTTWSEFLINRLNLNDNVQIDPNGQNYTPSQVILKKKFGYTNKMTFQNAVVDEEVTKVLLVRHPFARIVSAYENKLKNRKALADGQYFFQNYGALIYRKYRKDRRLKQREPTFSEFIDYLIDTDPINYDEHWQPVSLLCGLCNVQYNVIIKTEELDNRRAIWMLMRKKLGVANPSNYRLGWENKNVNANSKISNYFRNISRPKLVLLFKKYENDFRLFNFSYNEYV